MTKDEFAARTGGIDDDLLELMRTTRSRVTMRELLCMWIEPRDGYVLDALRAAHLALAYPEDKAARARAFELLEDAMGRLRPFPAPASGSICVPTQDIK